MRNLAGDPNCDRSIIDELQAVGVERVTVEKSGREVNASVTGKLGPFKFWRAWYYWVVEGPTPLHVAEEMYKNPIGRTEVRSGGHCGCPAPADYGVTHFDANGKVLMPLTGPDYKLIQDKPWSPGIADILASVEQKCRFVENPRAEAVKSIVDCYHIDSGEGLKLFVDTIRKYGLDKSSSGALPAGCGYWAKVGTGTMCVEHKNLLAVGWTNYSSACAGCMFKAYGPQTEATMWNGKYGEHGPIQ